MTFSFGYSGSYEDTERWLSRLPHNLFRSLDRHGQAGVDALARATPIDSGLTAQSWNYRIIQGARGPTIEWYNTNTQTGVNVAILLQYGHGTGTGGYVQGRDYINPAIQPVFDRILKDFLKEVR